MANSKTIRLAKAAFSSLHPNKKVRTKRVKAHNFNTALYFSNGEATKVDRDNYLAVIIDGYVKLTNAETGRSSFFLCHANIVRGSNL